MAEPEPPLPRALRRVDEAFQAFIGATTLERAHDAWEDFLVYWHRAVNKIELLGEEHNGKRWLRTQVWIDPILKYLRIARNAADHGLEPIMQRVSGGTSSPGFMIDLGEGIGISPRGRVGIMLADGLGMEFLPESLELVAVHTDRGESCDPPLRDGRPMRALDVGRLGIRFLTRAAGSVS